LIQRHSNIVASGLVVDPIIQWLIIDARNEKRKRVNAIKNIVSSDSEQIKGEKIVTRRNSNNREKRENDDNNQLVTRCLLDGRNYSISFSLMTTIES
jgi:hypothetical protein